MTKFRAILYDMDGVLIDSTPAHEWAFRAVLTPLRITDFDYAQVAGMRTDEAFEKIFSSRKMELGKAQLSTLVSKKRELALSRASTQDLLAPHCHAMLKALAGKAKQGLASSAGRAMVDLFLEKSRTRDFFQAIVTGEDVTKGKPDPEIFLRCAHLLQELPSDCLVIEDSQAGVEAALAGRFSVIAFGNKQLRCDNNPLLLGRAIDLRQIESYL